MVDLVLLILERVADKSFGTDTDSALRVVARDFAEQLDAADELLRAGVVGPARIIGRSCIELAAILRYLRLRSDERVAAAMFSHALTAAEHSLEGFGSLKGRKMETWDTRVAMFRKARINAEHGAQSRLEASRALEQLAHNEPWYAVRNGPGSVAQLLRTVGLPNLYDRYYVPWSSVVHGMCVITSDEYEDGQVKVRPLRNATHSEMLNLLRVLTSLGALVACHLSEFFEPRSSAEDANEAIAGLIEELQARPGDLLIPVEDIL
jgi:hypothetical protein